MDRFGVGRIQIQETLLEFNYYCELCVHILHQEDQWTGMDRAHIFYMTFSIFLMQFNFLEFTKYFDIFNYCFFIIYRYRYVHYCMVKIVLRLPAYNFTSGLNQLPRINRQIDRYIDRQIVINIDQPEFTNGIRGNGATAHVCFFSLKTRPKNPNFSKKRLVCGQVTN